MTATLARVYHVRANPTKDPVCLKPRTYAWHDVISRRNIRQIHAYAEQDTAIGQYFIQRITRGLVKQWTATATEVIVYLNATLKPMRTNHLANLKAFVYNIPVVNDRLNSWCTTMNGTHISRDIEPYQMVSELSLRDYLHGRVLKLISPDGTIKQVSL